MFSHAFKAELVNAGLALAGALMFGCSGNNTGQVDLLTPDPDLAMRSDMTAGPDMATPPDLKPLPPDLMPPTYNGCAMTDFVDQSGVGGVRTVTFGAGLGNAYSPRCMLIAAGQMATFTGMFGTHPLRPGVGSNATAGSPNNPITATNTGTTASFTFPTAGDYPYNCSNHDSFGMNGVIKVK